MLKLVRKEKDISSVFYDGTQESLEALIKFGSARNFLKEKDSEITTSVKLSVSYNAKSPDGADMTWFYDVWIYAGQYLIKEDGYYKAFDRDFVNKNFYIVNG